MPDINNRRDDDQDMIDITAEVQKLRLYYDQLVETKERREVQKRKNAENPPSKRSVDLYEMGKAKLLYERAIEEAQRERLQQQESRQDSGGDSRASTPASGTRGSGSSYNYSRSRNDYGMVPIEMHSLSICNRLYDEGMAKVMAKKMAEEAKREEEEARELLSKNPSRIPICDRLYEQGMTKVTAEKMAEVKKWEEKKEMERREGDDVAPIAVCDRLYKEGISKKIVLTKYDEFKKSRPRSQNPRETE